MGLLSLGPPKEKRTQLYFRDDGRFQFRRLEMEDTFLLEKNKDSVITRGWKHFFKNQFPFPGFKGISSDMVTMSFARDVLLDPYGLVPAEEKPDQGIRKKGENIREWLVEVGKARRLKILAKRGRNSNYDRITLFLGTGFLLEIVIILILAVQAKGGG